MLRIFESYVCRLKSLNILATAEISTSVRGIWTGVVLECRQYRSGIVGLRRSENKSWLTEFRIFEKRVCGGKKVNCFRFCRVEDDDEDAEMVVKTLAFRQSRWMERCLWCRRCVRSVRWTETDLLKDFVKVDNSRDNPSRRRRRTEKVAKEDFGSVGKVRRLCRYKPGS